MLLLVYELAIKCYVGRLPSVLCGNGRVIVSLTFSSLFLAIVNML